VTQTAVIWLKYNVVHNVQLTNKPTAVGWRGRVRPFLKSQFTSLSIIHLLMNWSIIPT